MKQKLLSLAALTLLAATAGAQTVNNGTMEAWHSSSVGLFNPTTIQTPNYWHGSDSLVLAIGPFLIPGGTFQRQIFKDSTTVHSGSYAARLVSRDQDTAIFPAALTNADININISDGTFSYTGGQAVTQRVDTVTAWIKYTAADGLDEGFFEASAIITGADGTDSVEAGTGRVDIASLASYTQVVVPILYDNVNYNPNLIRVTFSSSGGPTTAADGSTMWVDDVEMKVGATKVSVLDFENAAVKIFPNPSAGVLHFSTTQQGSLLFEAYNIAGQQMGKARFSGNGSIITAGWAPGLYTYRISNAAGTVQQGSFAAGK